MDELVIYINGEEFVVNETHITVKELLELASTKSDTFVFGIEHYVLYDTSTDDRYANLDDVVPLKMHDNLIAIYEGATPNA